MKLLQCLTVKSHEANGSICKTVPLWLYHRCQEDLKVFYSNIATKSIESINTKIISQQSYKLNNDEENIHTEKATRKPGRIDVVYKYSNYAKCS